jgi:hypothetical protein
MRAAANARRKKFVLEKKSQETLPLQVGAGAPNTNAIEKSLLLLFFRKEGLPCLRAAGNSLRINL